MRYLLITSGAGAATTLKDALSNEPGHVGIFATPKKYTKHGCSYSVCIPKKMLEKAKSAAKEYNVTIQDIVEAPDDLSRL